MARSSEPIWWVPFMAGAGVSAMLMPATILVTGLFTALGFGDRLYNLLANPLVRAYLFVLISLALFHGAHRIRFVLIDLGLKAARGPIAVLCYGGAIAGTIMAAAMTLGLL